MRRVLSAACFVLLLAPSTYSQVSAAATVAPTVTEAPSPIRSAGVLRTIVGSGTVLTVTSPVDRFAVGNEKMAAIHVVSDQEVLIQGLAPGRTTVFVWLADGRRLRYDLIIEPPLDVLRSAMSEVDHRIGVELSRDGGSVLLHGEVSSEREAARAKNAAQAILGAEQDANGIRVVSLLTYPGSGSESDARLARAMLSIDPRIQVRRIQVGLDPDNTRDSFVLEGRVSDVQALIRAMTIAELQLGGVGGKIRAVVDEEMDTGRTRGFVGTQSGGLDRLQSGTGRAGISTHVARGQALRTETGRVLSFLEVDSIPQILVSIRVLEVNRTKAHRLGIDLRFDNRSMSTALNNNPNRGLLPTPTNPPNVSSLTNAATNVVTSFVGDTWAVISAIDLLQQKDVARSVAEPNIATLSGEQASVLVGGEVPIPTAAVGQVATVQGVFFQDFGVRLDIRPTLAEDSMVALELSPSIIRPTNTLAVNGVPGFQVQSVNTTARVAAGQSLVLGGLISFTEGVEKRGIPVLSDAPVLGKFFGWEGKSREEQELLFVITPKLISGEKKDDVFEESLKWREVIPLRPGQKIELPPLDWDPDSDGTPTLNPDGMPPSFSPLTAPPETAPQSAPPKPKQ